MLAGLTRGEALVERPPVIRAARAAVTPMRPRVFLSDRHADEKRESAEQSTEPQESARGHIQPPVSLAIFRPPPENKPRTAIWSTPGPASPLRASRESPQHMVCLDGNRTVSCR